MAVVIAQPWAPGTLVPVPPGLVVELEAKLKKQNPNASPHKIANLLQGAIAQTLCDIGLEEAGWRIERQPDHAKWDTTVHAPDGSVQYHDTKCRGIRSETDELAQHQWFSDSERTCWRSRWIKKLTDTTIQSCSLTDAGLYYHGAFSFGWLFDNSCITRSRKEPKPYCEWQYEFLFRPEWMIHNL